MSKYILFFHSLWGLLGATPLFAQNQQTHFNYLPDNSLLAKEHIRAIHQDKQGLIWFGTRNGLVKYDGYEYQVFSHHTKDTISLPDDYIFSIIEDQKKEVLWVGTKNGLGRFDMQTEQFQNYIYSPLDSNGLSYPVIVNLIQSKDGQLWLALEGGGLNQFDPDTKTFTHHYPTGDKTPSKSSFNDIDKVLEDRKGHIWGSTHKGVFQLDRTANTFKLFPINMGTVMVNEGLAMDKNGQIFIGSKNGLFEFDTLTSTFHLLPLDYAHLKSLMGNISWRDLGGFFDMYIDSKHQLWMGFVRTNAVFRLNLNTYQVKVFHHDPFNETSLGKTHTQAFMEDRDGRLWIGNWVGLNYIDQYVQKFRHVTLQLSASKKGDIKPINGIWKDKKGHLWLAGGGHGLSKYNPITEKQELFLGENMEDPKYVFTKAFPYSENLVWLNGWKGTFAFDVSNKKFTTFPAIKGLAHKPDYFHPLDSTTLFLRSGNEWWLYDLKNQELSTIPNYIKQLGSLSYPLLKDKKGFIWLFVYNKKEVSLVRYLPDTQIFYHYRNNRLSSSLMEAPNCRKYFFKEDKKGDYWFACNGLYQVKLIEEDSIIVHRWQKEDSPLVSNTIFALEVDEYNNLWFPTEMGITRFNALTNQFDFFDTDACGQRFFLMAPSSFQDEAGWIYFSGKRGITWLHPDSIPSNTNPPPVILTGFTINNQNIPIKGTKEDTVENSFSLKQHIRFTKQLNLTYDQNDFGLTFTALDYSRPEKNRYAYLLEHYHDDWIETNAAQRVANFTNIPHGKYIFRVKAANGDGTWNKEDIALEINIERPWWKTWWAYLLYSVTVLTALYSFYRYQLTKKLAIAEEVRLKELHQLKSRLYTNITHEFRTPLTVMLGMTDTLESKISNLKLQGMTKSIEMIRRNGNHLLRLVNELLDLAKLDSGQLKLDLVQADVIPFIKYLCESFHSLAAKKQINLTVYSEIEKLWMDIDSKKLTDIISNLLTNAVKFTEANGKIIIHLKQESQYLFLKVKDNGIGIPESNLPHVFDRFYQGDNSTTRKDEGTGIGLALTKELISLMQGTIEVSSSPEKGSEFIIQLPISQNAAIGEIPNLVVNPTLLNNTSDDNFSAIMDDSALPLALLIEDNADVVHYLQICLADKYQTIHAADGLKGIELALAQLPGVIICDVMMPEKDGFEVCKILKMDERTNHIPIILLTAKASEKNRLHGLSLGADAYLTKPFKKAELFTRLEQLILLRQKMLSKLEKNPLYEFLQQRLENPEAKFLQNVIKIILKNIENPNLKSAWLAQKLHLSESQIYRKLKAITGKSTAIFIRTIRLQKARELLQTTDKTISEIAFQVGFQDYVWFSQAFKKEFGYAPREVTRG